MVFESRHPDQSSWNKEADFIGYILVNDIFAQESVVSRMSSPFINQICKGKRGRMANSKSVDATYSTMGQLA